MLRRSLSLAALLGSRSLATTVRSSLALAKNSHAQFFLQRDWQAVDATWREAVRTGELPPGLADSNEASLPTTSQLLREVQTIGEQGEFQSKDTRYSKRRTYALRIGYLGTEYFGYQRQGTSSSSPPLRTVESEVFASLQRASTCAGRTDRDVSALAQVLSFTTSLPIDTQALLEKLRSAEACTAGRLAFYDCVRVPRKLNARSQAMWRRYVYLFPLSGDGDSTSEWQGTHVDCDFVDACLRRLEGTTICGTALAYREDRVRSEGQEPLDKCVFLYSRARSAHGMLCIELVADRFLRRMVRIIAGTAIRESTLPSDVRDVDILHRICRTRDESLASTACPGKGLALCGVGFDLEDLSEHVHMTRAARTFFDHKFNRDSSRHASGGGEVTRE